MALVAAMSYIMMSRLERDTYRTSLLLRNTQAELLAQGSVYWAIDQLKTNLINQKANQLTDVTPIKSPVNTEDGFTIQSTIYNMQARYNLNNLQSKPADQTDLIKLIKTVSPNVSNEQATNIAKAVVDWLSPAKDTVFDKYYSNLPQPYRSAHRLMVTSSELTLVKGMTPKLYLALQPYITALPMTTGIDVMTADVPVLMLLDPAMTTEVANAIVTLRKGTPIVSGSQFLDIPLVKNHNITNAAKLATTSNYFLVETIVTIEKQKLVLYTLLERSITSDKPSVSIVWQSKGIW